MKKDLYINSPLIESLRMGQIVDSRVWLKMDCLQPSGSFKLRGISHACKKYIDKGAKEFISSSGGNAGMAVAYSGRLLNTPVTVVVPETTKKIAIDMIQREGANVIVQIIGTRPTIMRKAWSLIKINIFIHSMIHICGKDTQK